MTVFFSKKCEIGIQAVLFLSTRSSGELFNATEIAEHTKTPKEFIAKILQGLTPSGIVGSKKGKNGGFFLAKMPSEIKIIDIVAQIDGLESFSTCVLGFPGCSAEKPCPVHESWGKIREQAYQMLSSQTLENLRIASNEKINSIKN
mgnify:CR=1 FL=1